MARWSPALPCSSRSDLWSLRLLINISTLALATALSTSCAENLASPGANPWRSAGSLGENEEVCFQGRSHGSIFSFLFQNDLLFKSRIVSTNPPDAPLYFTSECGGKRRTGSWALFHSRSFSVYETICLSVKDAELQVHDTFDAASAKMMAGAILLFYFAPHLAHNAPVFYTSGAGLGIFFAVILIFFFIFSRYGKARFAVLTGLVGSLMQASVVYFGQTLWDQYGLYIFLFGLVCAMIGFAVAYNMYPTLSERSLNLFQWALQSSAIGIACCAFPRPTFAKFPGSLGQDRTSFVAVTLTILVPSFLHLLSIKSRSWNLVHRRSADADVDRVQDEEPPGEIPDSLLMRLGLRGAAGLSQRRSRTHRNTYLSRELGDAKARDFIVTGAAEYISEDEFRKQTHLVTESEERKLLEHIKSNLEQCVSILSPQARRALAPHLKDAIPPPRDDSSSELDSD